MSEPSSPAPQVSVIIVTYNSEATIDRCLDAIALESRRLPLETLIVDNASTDATVERIQARATPPLRLTGSTENPGFGTAINLAAQTARGRHLLLLNPDAILRPRAVAELVAALERSPGVGVVGPRVVGADGTRELSTGAGSGFAAEAWQRLRSSAHRFGLGRHGGRSVRYPGWVSGACLLIERRLWDQLGGMDESMFLYLEDVDLCLRARAAGRDVLYWPAAEVEHCRGVSVASAATRAACEHRRSQLHLYREHHGVDAMELLRTLLGLKLRISRGWATLRGRAEQRRRADDALTAVRQFR